MQRRGAFQFVRWLREEQRRGEGPILCNAIKAVFKFVTVFVALI